MFDFLFFSSIQLLEAITEYFVLPSSLSASQHREHGIPFQCISQFIVNRAIEAAVIHQ